MYSREFKNWARKQNVTVLKEMGGFSIGQKVTYTNEYGVSFENRAILGFCEPVLNGRCVFLNNSSYWFPVLLSEIRLEK